MIKNIIGTISSRITMAGLGFFIALLTTWVLEAEGRGMISYFVMNMSLIVLINNLLGGPALVYLTPRHQKWKLLLPSYVWSIVCSAACCVVLYYTERMEPSLLGHLFIITVLNSWNADNLMVLLGEERIKVHNLIALLQVILLVSFLLLVFYVFHQQEVMWYIYGLYISFGSCFICSIFYLLSQRNTNTGSWRDIIAYLSRYGSQAQASNIIQFFNLRLTYYFILNEATLGIYANAIALTEATWIIGRSLATVQYSRISNTTDDGYHLKITLQMFRVSLLLLVLAVIVLLLLPRVFYSWLFQGEEFQVIHSLIAYLAPGTIALGGIATISPYFSGRGIFWPSILSSFVGMIVTLTGCLLIIPLYGINGAAITTSLSYIVLATTMVVVLYKKASFRLNALLPQVNDFKAILALIK